MSDGSPSEEFDWRDLHGLAGKLIEFDDEAAQRGAVSRDYYAVFNCAKEVLEDFRDQWLARSCQAGARGSCPWSPANRRALEAAGLTSATDA